MRYDPRAMDSPFGSSSSEKSFFDLDKTLIPLDSELKIYQSNTTYESKTKKKEPMNLPFTEEELDKIDDLLEEFLEINRVKQKSLLTLAEDSFEKCKQQLLSGLDNAFSRLFEGIRTDSEYTHFETAVRHFQDVKNNFETEPSCFNEDLVHDSLQKVFLFDQIKVLFNFMNLNSINNVLERLDKSFEKFLIDMQSFWKDQNNKFNFSLQKIKENNSKFQSYLTNIHNVWDEPILHKFQYKGQAKQFENENLENFKNMFLQQKNLKNKPESLDNNFNFEKVKVFNPPKELQLFQFKRSSEYVKRCFLLNSCPHTLLLEHVLKVPLVTTKISLKKLNSKSTYNENAVIMNSLGRVINLIVSPSDRFIGIKLEKQKKLQIVFYDLHNPQGQFQPNFDSEIKKLKVTSFVFLDPPKKEQLAVVCEKGKLHLHDLTKNTWEKDLIKTIDLLSIFYLDSKRLIVYTKNYEIGVFSFETRSIGNLVKLNDSIFTNPANFVQSKKPFFIFITPLFTCLCVLRKSKLILQSFKEKSLQIPH
jgi:hypothetical protein